jgi:hypothetical protein
MVYGKKETQKEYDINRISREVYEDINKFTKLVN